FCAGERVMGINRNMSGLKRDNRVLAIALKVLTRRLPAPGSEHHLQHPKHKSPNLATAYANQPTG
ncbi:hypothetical protein HMPREF2621_08425, partial [Lactobacillus sp. HMSC072E07]